MGGFWGRVKLDIRKLNYYGQAHFFTSTSLPAWISTLLQQTPSFQEDGVVHWLESEQDLLGSPDGQLFPRLSLPLSTIHLALHLLHEGPCYLWWLFPHPFTPTMFPFADFPGTTFTTLHQGCTVNETQILPSENYPRLKWVPQTELLSIPDIIKDIMAPEPRQTSNKEEFI